MAQIEESKLDHYHRPQLLAPGVEPAHHSLNGTSRPIREHSVGGHGEAGGAVPQIDAYVFDDRRKRISAQFEAVGVEALRQQCGIVAQE